MISPNNNLNIDSGVNTKFRNYLKLLISRGKLTAKEYYKIIALVNDIISEYNSKNHEIRVDRLGVKNLPKLKKGIFKKSIICIIIIAVVFTVAWILFAYRDVDHIKRTAPRYLAKRGYRVEQFSTIFKDINLKPGFKDIKGSLITGGSVRYVGFKESNAYNIYVYEWNGKLYMEID
ncbi:MAG: hypothetical protein JEZ03_17170 [Bacteroidales bacterium]|nr:hypothetical protein [Bacteroidales bacterium]